MNFDTLIDRKNTDCVKWDALQEVYGRSDVLPLWIADMDFKSSPKIIEALINRAEHGVFGYPIAPKKIFRPFIEWNRTRNGLEIDEDWIMTCPGVAVAFSIGVQAYTKEGDGVMIQTPVYPPFHSAVKNNNRIMVENELIENDGYYTINFEDFERKIVDKNVKLFILCNPHNPVGRVWDKDELEKMADICLKHNVKIFSDEIHSDLIFKERRFISVLSLDEKYKKILITAMAPSKTFNIPGLYSSIVLIPDNRLKDDYKRISDGLAIGEITIFGLTAMEAAYKYGEEWLERVMEYIEENADFFETYIKENMPEIKYRKPEGTYLGWLDFRNIFSRQEDLDDYLINKAKVALNSGKTFGKNGEGFVRINLGCHRSTLTEALNRIKVTIPTVLTSS